PDWDDSLREDLRRETEMLFESVMREVRNILDFLNADYTFINDRLARHYGIPNIYGSPFRRVTRGPEFDYRRGLLGQGSILSITSLGERTSPVKRGVWVLENILGTPPPEPPPNVPPLEQTEEPGRVLTLREKMTLHRTNEPCASCHRIMDPIGFALENFDADAKFRRKDNGEGGSPIDAAAQLYDGTMINGPSGLREALLKYSPQFVRMLTEKLMTYGLGRGVEYFDMPVVRSIVRDAGAQNNRFSAIVLGIVKSAPFQMRMKAGGEIVIITKKHIPPRTFLWGAGVTLALPLLDSMLPAQTPQRETAAAPGSIRRFVGVWHPHGAAPRARNAAVTARTTGSGTGSF